MIAKRSLWLGVIGVVLASPALAAALMHLESAGVIRFDVADTGRVSIGPSLATQDRLLLEDQTPGDRTFTVRSTTTDGVTVKDRIVLEKNLAEPYDLDFHSVALVLGDTAGPNLPSPIQNLTPAGSYGPQYTIFKPGSNTSAALYIMATGQIRSQVQGLTTNAWIVQNAGEANPHLAVDGSSGGISWGAGGGSSLDVSLTRGGAGALQVAGDLAVTGRLTGTEALRRARRLLTAPATILSTDRVIEIDCSAGSFSLTLPDAATCSGAVLLQKRVSGGANTVTISALPGQAIDGRPSWALAAQYAGMEEMSDGANWLITNHLGSVQ